MPSRDSHHNGTLALPALAQAAGLDLSCLQPLPGPAVFPLKAEFLGFYFCVQTP